MEPNEFPGNSNKGKEVKRQAPKGEKPKVEKVVKGEAIKIKKPFGQRFKEVFLGGDAKSAGRYITTDVLLPALRNLIVDATTKGVERVIYGDNRMRRQSAQEYGRPRVQYNNPISRYSSPGARLPDQQPLRQSRGADDIVLVSREEAETVIERLTDIVDQYEIASVADLYDLVGLPTTYVDNKWGWTNLAYANVRQIREGYLLDLPRAEPIS